MNIKDIAKLSGVSISTVSRVINNSARVRDEVKKRVERVIEETGYRPNSLAKELLNNKTNTIGVILPRIDLWNYSIIVKAISKHLSENGYNMILGNTNDNIDEELKYFKLFQEKRVDGVLYFATGITKEHIKLINKMPYPIIMVSQKNDKLKIPYIANQNYEAAKAITNFLIDNGHKKIAAITVPDYDKEIGKRRKEGYLDSLKENGIKIEENYIYVGDFEYNSGYYGAKHILENSKEKPTAIFAITDKLAIGAINYLAENGYKIPDDISVVGIDNLQISKFCNPSLTTVGFDYYEVGTKASKNLMKLIDEKKYNFSDRDIEKYSHLVEFSLKIRKSVNSLL